MSASSGGLPHGARLVLAASLLLSLWTALRFPLVDPDEGRNAEVAREMAAGWDVVVPHLAGMPYLDKPPALFAAAALAIRALGPTRLAARLPAMLASLVTLWLLARAAARRGDPAQAVRATLLCAAAPLFAVLSAYVIFDMPLTACVTVVWLGVAAEAERARAAPAADGARAATRRAVMFVAVALGVLIKGPVMLAWAVGGSLTGALLMRSRAPLAWLAWWPGWVIVLALAGGWFALALRRHPEYARYAFLEESIERMASGSFHREQPWWFVPVVLVVGALPWAPATPWRAPVSRTGLIAAAFVLFPAVFFTLSRSKLVTYLLPAIPALAWWAAECWGRRAARLPVALAAALLFTPVTLTAGSPWLARAAAERSGEPLAAALARAGAVTVRYEDCYSPGSDFRLGRLSKIVSASGHELASNYVVRYRETLRARGQWTPLDPGSDRPAADVVVVPARTEADGRRRFGTPLFHDGRFAAFAAGP